MQAVSRVVALSPAVAMRPSVPPRYRRGATWSVKLNAALSPLSRMAFRSAIHNRMRSTMTTISLAMSSAILIASLYLADSMEHLVDVEYMTNSTGS